MEINRILPKLWVFCGEGEIMKIKNIRIQDVGGIKNLLLEFNSGLNLICGPNGVGKTTIIEAIGNAFSYGNEELTRRSGCEFGEVNLNLTNSVSGRDYINYKVEKFRPDENNQFNGNKHYMDMEQIFMFKTHREITYEFIDAIKRDPKLDTGVLSERIKFGIQGQDIKTWFVNRFIFYHLKTQSSLREEQRHNFAIAEKCFAILDKTIKFKDVSGDTFDILLETLNGDIYFEYLSDGYKMCIYILLGIIKEIEYRFKEPYIMIDEFEGTIIIDELDLHLHPQWQAGLVSALKEIFKKAQIIATTHSPSMLQTVSSNEIIVLGKNDMGEVYTRKLKLGKYGLQGWTIEEILEEIMGMPTTSSDRYLEVLKDFDSAMNDENGMEIIRLYKILKEMLHPDNPLQRLLKIQVAGWEE